MLQLTCTQFIHLIALFCDAVGIGRLEFYDWPLNRFITQITHTRTHTNKNITCRWMILLIVLSWTIFVHFLFPKKKKKKKQIGIIEWKTIVGFRFGLLPRT